MVDWAEVFPGEIKFVTAGGDLTESKMFVNPDQSTRHTALDLLGIWTVGNKIGDHTDLVAALFAPGSEAKFTIKRIRRPTRAGEGGFATFEAGLDVTEPWGVETDRGILPAQKITLLIRVELMPVH